MPSRIADVPEAFAEHFLSSSLTGLLDEFVESVNLAHRMHYEQFTRLIAMAEALNAGAMCADESAALFGRLSETSIHFELNTQINAEAFRSLHNQLLRRLLGATPHDTDHGGFFHACRLGPSTTTRH
ncbi:hypothetical protein R75461_08357 [Paraburkholderia nemoris]|uniref:hypothetical protein n=1 Tax=Paraburkholderia nemoris TaxID=2793076 RepID=UPI00190BFD43|nr:MULTISPECIES: hypothetical protein [Paraburkholderia]MBK3787132.1 hypothetical protein [Paraburkholderia aspalathi]CAE6867270.1 hypothetical protein R75461_08357 [Paraburkholderia nemoris]